MTNFHAEERPSDGDYLAFAGGSTFGVPLDDPEEENPLYTIDAKPTGHVRPPVTTWWRSLPSQPSVA